jgi:hypothetical protein
LKLRTIVCLIAVLGGVALGLAHVGVDLPRGTPAPPPDPLDQWTGAVWCRAHARLFHSVRGRVVHESPAGERLLSAIYGLMLFGPEARFPVQLVARGHLSTDGGTLFGDLCLRGVHPALFQQQELWSAVRAVRLVGIQRIVGRILWEAQLPSTGAAAAQPAPDLDAWLASGPGDGRPLLLHELEQRLRLAGVQIEPPAAAAPAGPDLQEIELYAHETRPLSLLLRRDLGLLLPLMPEPSALGRLLGNIDSRHRDWIPPAYPRLSSEQLVDLLRKGLQHERLGPELAAALPAVRLGEAAGLVRGVLVRERQITELAGVAELEGHGQVLVGLRVLAEVPDERLGPLLERALRLDVDVQLFARQELPGLDSSSEHQRFNRPGVTR